MGVWITMAKRARKICRLKGQLTWGRTRYHQESLQCWESRRPPEHSLWTRWCWTIVNWTETHATVSVTPTTHITRMLVVVPLQNLLNLSEIGGDFAGTTNFLITHKYIHTQYWSWDLPVCFFCFCFFSSLKNNNTFKNIFLQALRVDWAFKSTN